MIQADEARPDGEAAAASIGSDVEALYAQAARHYRQRHWEAARDAFLRVREADPSWRDIDAVLDDLDSLIRGEHDQPQVEAVSLHPAAARVSPAQPARRVKAVAARSGRRRWLAIPLALFLIASILAALLYTGLLPMPTLSLLGAASDAANTQRYINRGRAAFIVDKYEDAITAFQKALELDPGNGEAAAALQKARDYLQMQSDYAEAGTLVDEQQFDLALDKLRAVVAVDPWYRNANILLAQCELYDQVDTLYQQAMAHIDASEWPNAIAALEAAQDADPTYRRVEIESKLVEAYVNEGRERIVQATRSVDILSASLSFGAALAVVPGNALAQQEKELSTLYYDGFTAYERANWSLATTSLSRLYDARSDYAGGQVARLLCDTYARLADGYRSSGLLEAALEQYRALLGMSECDQVEARREEQEILQLLSPPAATPGL